MLCGTCAKLASKYTQKICIKCSKPIIINIYTICDICSNSEKKCSACLKKISNIKTKSFSGCRTCGKK